MIFLKTSQPDLIETIKNELANASIFKANMEQMDLITQTFYDGFNNLADPRPLAAKKYQKYNIHLGEAMKSDYREAFMKAM